MRQVVHTAAAPAAIGPYSQAIVAGGQVWTAGIIALSPDSGELVAGDVAAETRQTLANLQAILAGAGSGLDRVVKTTLFLVDMADFAAVNAVYGEFFPAQPPARATVAVASLPRGARVEIDAVAVLGW
jgi:2-iminobutanoate/2-iminopropanoate deaminase